MSKKRAVTWIVSKNSLLGDCQGSAISLVPGNWRATPEGWSEFWRAVNARLAEHVGAACDGHLTPVTAKYQFLESDLHRW